MIPSGLFTQIAIAALSVGIIFTFIRPTLTEVSQTQDTIAVYQEKITEVDLVNSSLNKLYGEMSNVSKEQKDRLAIYIPNSVDNIAVPRDITFIAEESGILLREVTYEGALKESPSGEEDTHRPTPHTFKVGFDGTYNQIKRFIQLLEQNNYPLEVHELTVSKIEGGFLSADMSLVTYSSKEVTNE